MNDNNPRFTDNQVAWVRAKGIAALTEFLGRKPNPAEVMVLDAKLHAAIGHMVVTTPVPPRSDYDS